MSSLDELILFNSAFWREEGMLDGTKYAYMKKLAEHCRRAAGGNFPAGYYEPESMPYMLALRDACHPSGPLAGAGTRGRTYAFDIRERVPETTPLASVHIRLPRRKRYTELAYLFEYEGKERLVFKVTRQARSSMSSSLSNVSDGRAYCRKASASAGATWRAIINRGSRCSCPIRIWYGVPPPILNSGLECVS